MVITRSSHLLGLLVCSVLAMAQGDIQGVCLTGPPKPIGSEVMDDIRAINAEWVCLMPYAYGPASDGSLKRDVGAWQWWGEKKEGTRRMIRMAHEAGLQVMLKPHLWRDHGSFTGAYMARSEKEWRRFEADYEEYLLDFAELAEEEDAELLCIGTELEKFVQMRTAFWQRLIDRITDIYSGPITYAANWDEVHRFPLWSRMSFVGVDGYFPLTDDSDRSTQRMSSSWNSRMEELDQLCDSVDRKMVFCEIGYRSCRHCTDKPWEHDDSAPVDYDCQVDAFKCFFQAARASENYAGSFLWKWFAPDMGLGGRRETGYTPQDKPVLGLIKREFGKTN